MSNPLCRKPHTGRGLCYRTIGKKEKRKLYLTSVKWHPSDYLCNFHGCKTPWSSFPFMKLLWSVKHKAKWKSFPILKSVLALQRAYILYTAYEPLPKGKYFNQFPIIDIANLQSVLVSGIDPLNGFDFACSCWVNCRPSGPNPVVGNEIWADWCTVHLNQKTKVILQDLCPYDLYLNVQESSGSRNAETTTDW